MDDKACPFCGSDELSVESGAEDWWINCDDCGASGPHAPSEREAEQRWNARRTNGDT